MKKRKKWVNFFSYFLELIKFTLFFFLAFYERKIVVDTLIAKCSEYIKRPSINFSAHFQRKI